MCWSRVDRGHACARHGANLKPASVRTGKPEIGFLRERFAISEAMTYYHFVLETAIDEGA